MKKVFLLFILLLTITGTLAGCADDNSHQTFAQNETDTSETNEKEELDITSQIIVMQQLQKMYGLYE